MDKCISGLSDALFWDVDKATVDPEKNAKWIVERVLERGRWEDWLAIRDRYGKSRLAELAPSLHLDGKSSNFLAIYCAL